MPRKKKTRKFYKKGKTQKKKGSKFLNLFIFILALVVTVYTFSFVKRLTQTEAIGSPEPILIKLEVLNGCGVPGAAQKVRDFLLTQEFDEVNFDVINVGNFTDNKVPETLIWDRVGNATIAGKVALLLGIKGDNVSHHFLKKNYLDVELTLILGKDYQKILEIGRTKK